MTAALCPGCGVNDVHTHPAKVETGLWPSPGGHATLSDGTRALIICDLGGEYNVGGITIDDPTTLDRLADYATAAAQRLRQHHGDLEECSGCGLRAPREEMHECANSIPGMGRGPFHCHDCLASGCCGACQDEAAREHQAEQRADIARYGP